MLGYPFTQYANDWLSACKLFDETGDDSEKIRHRNSKQARPWKRKVGKSVEPSMMFQLREPLEPLPEDCVILTAGVDVQDDRLEIQVNGFGELDGYFIDHFKIDGDPRILFKEEGSPWDLLQEFLTGGRYENQWGSQQPIFAMAIDLGFQKPAAKYFINNANLLYFQKIFGVYGRPETNKVAINFIQNATTDLDGWESWGLYTNVKKAALYNLFDLHIQGKGHLHFSDKRCFSERWFRQLTVERPNERGIFEKPHSHARNEALDCCIYAHAAYELCTKGKAGGFDFESFKRWNKDGCGEPNRKSTEVISAGEVV
jgi:phage terminase large subunit GpA-like protein